MKVVALDYGAARTGVAVTAGELARPLTTIERIGSAAGMERLLAILREEQPELLLVGLPLAQDGSRGKQANATLAFVGRLQAVCDVPIEMEDERFTSRIAQTKGGSAGLDDRAAAELLQGWLDRRRPA